MEIMNYNVQHKRIEKKIIKKYWKILVKKKNFEKGSPRNSGLVKLVLDPTFFSY